MPMIENSCLSETSCHSQACMVGLPLACDWRISYSSILPNLAIAAPCIYSRKLIARAILAPPNRCLTIIHQDRMRTTLSHESLFVFPIDFLPLLDRRTLPDRLRSLIEHAPTATLHDSELLKSRPGRKRQLFDSELSP